MTDNVFLSASAKARAGMEKTAQTAGSKERRKPESERMKGRKGINVRVSPDLHRRMMAHRTETGENMNELIIRLLEQELG